MHDFIDEKHKLKVKSVLKRKSPEKFRTLLLRFLSNGVKDYLTKTFFVNTAPFAVFNLII